MAVSENCNFQHVHGTPLHVTQDMMDAFQANGYVIVRSLLSSEELLKMKETLEREDGVLQYSYGREDGHGKTSRMCLWNVAGEDLTGMVGRCRKVAETMEQLLKGEIYHYHAKLMMKEPHTGGSFVWHQDYGYWYKNGCLYPDMGTVFIAIDKCDRENGCLKVLKGSHKLGRIDHQKVGDLLGADPERVEQVMEVLPVVEVEMDPGDALFFHCNVLHCSDQNRSNRRRWAFLIAYNRASNDPVIVHVHPNYTKLHMVADSAILECPTPVDLDGKAFYIPAKHDSLNGWTK